MELFEIDASGRVRDYQGTRLSRWQVRNRDFVRELGWTIGAAATERIVELRARGLDLDRFAARVTTRAGAEDLEITVRRCRDVTMVSIGRDRVIRAPRRSL